MPFLKVLALRGPNLWANLPVIDAWLDPACLPADRPQTDRRLTDRLHAWLPGLATHACPHNPAGGLLEQLSAGTSYAHVLQHLAVELERLATAAPTGFESPELTVDLPHRVAVPFRNERLTRCCLDIALDLLSAALGERTFDLASALAALRDCVAETRLDPVTAAVIQSARLGGIPVRLFEAERLVQLGHGSRQRRVLGARTDRTNAVAASVAREAGLVRSLLRSAGVPVLDEDEASPSSSSQHLLLVAGRKLLSVVHKHGDVLAAANADPHPDLAARALEAVSMLQLDLAAVEIAADDLARPLEDQNGVVLAVHPDPDLDAFIQVDPQSAERIGDRLVASLFPSGQTGRIPIVGVTGVNGKTTTTRLIAHILDRKGDRVGMATTDGIYVGNRRIDDGDCSGPQSARTILLNPAVDAAVLETARGGVLREGLGFDRCDVAVVTNIGEGDHLGLNGIDTPEQLARVKGTLVRAVSRTGTAVINAEDPLVAGMTSWCPGSVACFALQGDHPVLLRHRTSGGRVAFVRDNTIVLADGASEFALMSLDLVPLTHYGRIGFQVQNVLAAALATWALGVPCEIIRAALETFSSSIDKAPGRFNVLDVRGATVIFDYGHNPSSLMAVIDSLKQFPHRRRLAVYSAAGDRRDCDLIRQGELLGDAFDQVFLFEGQYVRGRTPGEIVRLFHQGLQIGRRVAQIHDESTWRSSVDRALRLLQSGDLLLIQADEVNETVAYVQHCLMEAGLGREVEPAGMSGPVPQPHVAPNLPEPLEALAIS